MHFHQQGNSGVLFALMHPRLQRVADKAADMGYEFQIIVSYRSPEQQLAAYKAKRSAFDGFKRKGAHNFNPSRAFDFIAHPFGGWNDIPQFRSGGHIFNAAATLIGDNVTWGGDWNDNGSEADEHGLRDFDHIELTNWRLF